MIYLVLLDAFQSHTKKVMEQIKATQGETEELADKLKRKIALHGKLVDEFEKNNRNINRFVRHDNFHIVLCTLIITNYLFCYSHTEIRTHRVY